MMKSIAAVLDRRTYSAGLLAAAVAVAGCDSTSHPTEASDAVFQNGVGNGGALFEAAWGDGQKWELVKPRPPGLGVDVDKAVHLYIVAPLIQGSPLSPPIPGLVGGRDHVVPLPPGNAGEFKGVARTVPLVPANPIDPRVAWAFITVVGAPGGQVPTLYAVQLEGEECPRPLSRIERVRAAIEQGLAIPAFPPEPAWPFAVRPTTEPGKGRVTIPAPSACVPPGERVGG